MNRVREWIAGFPFYRDHGGMDRTDQRVHMTGRLSAGERRLHCAAPFMSEHHDETCAEVRHCVFDTAQRVVIHQIPRGANDEKIADALIEDDLRPGARIRTTDDN